MKRLRRAKDKEDIFQSLGGDSTALFRSMKDVFMVAACLGFARDTREPLQSIGAEFGPNVFAGEDEALLDALALAEAGEVAILHPDQEDARAQLVEEYANAGVALLKGIMDQGVGDPVDTLITFLASEADGLTTRVALR